jgi:hypothetical protein
VEYPVIVEILGELGDIGLALLGIGAVDTAKRRGSERRGAAAKEGVDVNVYEESPVIGVDDVIEV